MGNKVYISGKMATKVPLYECHHWIILKGKSEPEDNKHKSWHCSNHIAETNTIDRYLYVWFFPEIVGGNKKWILIWFLYMDQHCIADSANINVDCLNILEKSWLDLIYSLKSDQTYFVFLSCFFWWLCFIAIYIDTSYILCIVIQRFPFCKFLANLLIIFAAWSVLNFHLQIQSKLKKTISIRPKCEIYF